MVKPPFLYLFSCLKSQIYLNCIDKNQQIITSEKPETIDV